MKPEPPFLPLSPLSSHLSSHLSPRPRSQVHIHLPSPTVSQMGERKERRKAKQSKAVSRLAQCIETTEPDQDKDSNHAEGSPCRSKVRKRIPRCAASSPRLGQRVSCQSPSVQARAQKGCWLWVSRSPSSSPSSSRCRRRRIQHFLSSIELALLHRLRHFNTTLKEAGGEAKKNRASGMEQRGPRVRKSD